MFPSSQPHLAQANLESLISPACIQIPKTFADQIQNFVREIYTFSHSQTYDEKFRVNSLDVGKISSPQTSVLMSYDFHFDFESMTPKLIEINTNAGAYLFSHLAYSAQNLENPFGLDSLQILKESFIQEAKLGPGSRLDPFAIVDHKIPEQKMNLEFYMYLDLLRTLGVRGTIAEVGELNFESSTKTLCLNSPEGEALGGISFVYNRHTDFLFESELSSPLKSAYLNGSTTISPNPREYLRLADKNLLKEWQTPENRGSLPKEVLNCLLESFTPKNFASTEALWAQRKKYFFKPKNSFGSKSAYKGSSISKTVFQRMIEDDCLVQEYIAPPEVELEIFGETKRWKYDVRVFAYEDSLQFAAARIYQGQLTNFQNPYGGITPIQFS